MLQLRAYVTQVMETQEAILAFIRANQSHQVGEAQALSELTKQFKKLERRERVIITKRPKLLVSQNGKAVHVDNCPYAKNIQEPLTVPSLELAEARGYSRCECTV